MAEQSFARSGVARGRKVTSAQAPSLSARPGTRPLLRTAVGGKGLLPTKMKTSGVEAMRARSIFTSSKMKLDRQRAADAYDVYLLDFVNRCLIEDGNNLQEGEHLEAGVTEFVDVLATSHELNKLYVNKVLLLIADDMKSTDVIVGEFDNLVDFAGEESLVELQTLLAKKFEKIPVLGAEISRPLFKDVELASIAEKVRTHLSKNMELSRVAGLVQNFNENLKKLVFLSEKTLKRNVTLRRENRIALEHSSLSICALARDNYIQKHENDIEEHHQGDVNEERAQLDED